MAFGRLARDSAGRGARPFADINVTPLVDVMLVLLVIFIVAVPLLASRLALELPAAEGASAEGTPAAVLAVALEADGSVRVAGQPVPAAALRGALETAAREALARDPATELQISADRAVPYGRVAEVIGWVQAAGLLRIGLVAAPAAPTEVAPGPPSTEPGGR